MDKILESQKLAASDEKRNLSQRANLLSQLIEGLQNKAIYVWHSREFEKMLKNTKDELGDVNAELDSLAHFEKELKIKDDSQGIDLAKLDEESKKAHKELNLTGY